jgi:predicted nucleic acid-binding protein
MGIKIFIDTNVVIDFFDPLRAEHFNARKLFSVIEKREVSGYVSESVLNTSVYILRKQFLPTELRVIIADLLSVISLLPCSTETYLQSLKLSGNDIEDASLYQLAIENRLDYFVTEDKKDFKKISSHGLPVVSSKEFLNING